MGGFIEFSKVFPKVFCMVNRVKVILHGHLDGAGLMNVGTACVGVCVLKFCFVFCFLKMTFTKQKRHSFPFQDF